MKKYIIKRDVLGAPGELEIDSLRFDQIKNSAQVRLETLYLEQKYDFVIENYIELEETLLRTGVHDMILGGQNSNWFLNNRSLFNRRIMNLLTTTKAYADAYPQHLNRIFGKNSSELERIEAEFSRQYDNRIGYRTMCKLRNFVQHQGLPVHGTHYNARRIPGRDDEKGLLRNTIDPYLRPDELREGDFNKTILKELEQLGEKIHLKFLIRDFLEGLSEGHTFVRQTLKDSLEQASNKIDESVQLYFHAFPGDASRIGLMATKTEAEVEKEDLNVEMDQIYLGSEAQEYLSYLIKKNRPLTGLTRNYISSEIVKE